MLTSQHPLRNYLRNSVINIARIYTFLNYNFFLEESYYLNGKFVPEKNSS